MDNQTPPRRRRRRWKILAGLFVLVIILIAGLPWILSSRLAHSRISEALNRAFAPGKIGFDSIELGWFHSTRLTNVVLMDSKDKVVARVPTAVLDRTLGQLIQSSHGTMLLSLDDTALEVARSEKGIVDLAEALQTVISHPDPLRDLTIRIDRGTLDYRDPFLKEPSTADSVSLVLRIPMAPNPVSWDLKLSKRDSNLEIQGDFDRWLAKGGPSESPELRLGIVGKQWPLVANVAEVDALGWFDGTVDFSRKRGKWSLTGDARLDGLRAQGKPLAGDTLAIDRLEAGWDLVQNDQGWTIRRLGLNCPLGAIKAEGQLSGPGGIGKQRIEANLDLAAVARQLPHAARLRDGLIVQGGSARVVLDVDSTLEKSIYQIEAKLTDLTAKDHDRNLSLREPAILTGRLLRMGKDSTLERLAVKTSFLEASASGRFEDGVNLQGTIDLEGFRRQLGEWVDLGALDMAGKVELSGVYRVQSAGKVVTFNTPAWIQDAKGTPFSGSPQPLEADLFVNSMTAIIHDLRLNGLGVGPVRRDSLNLNLAMNGPVDNSGWPLAWKALFVQLKDGQAEGRLRLDASENEMTLVSARASLPITTSDRPRSAQLSADGNWSNERRIFSFSELSLAEAGSKLSISARGNLDLAAGELILDAIPGKTSEALMIAPDGFRISGLGKGLGSLRLEGNLSGDAAKLDQLVADIASRSPIGLAGRWSAQASARGEEDGMRLSAKVGLVDPSTKPSKNARPTWMSLNAAYSPKLDKLDVAEFAVSTPYGTLEASGRLDEPMGARRVDLKGNVSPDFEVITALLKSKIEPGAGIAGRPRSFRATGTLDDSSGGWKGVDAEFGFDLLGADIYGMKFGASPVVLRARNGKLAFDPISTSLNEGHVRLEPEIDLDAPGGPTIRLAKNSNIRDARINDEVSSRVLAYVAPVLDKATRVSGLVSVDLDHAEFPLGPNRRSQAIVEGAVLFEDVEFAPGPLAGEILGAIGRRDLSLKLDQPVTLTIADGRINQRGMSIPIGDLTRVELSGWVDFDRKLGMVATVPVTASMLGNNPLLSDIAAGMKVRLPIGGTLDKPKVDREAFSKELQELGKTLLTRGATRGAMELLMRMGRPKDPDAPPPPPRLTPQEKKAQRQEKKAIRRGEILPPDPEAPKI